MYGLWSDTAKVTSAGASLRHRKVCAGEGARYLGQVPVQGRVCAWRLCRRLNRNEPYGSEVQRRASHTDRRACANLDPRNSLLIRAAREQGFDQEISGPGFPSDHDRYCGGCAGYCSEVTTGQVARCHGSRINDCKDATRPGSCMTDVPIAAPWGRQSKFYRCKEAGGVRGVMPRREMRFTWKPRDVGVADVTPTGYGTSPTLTRGRSYVQCGVVCRSGGWYLR